MVDLGPSSCSPSLTYTVMLVGMFGDVKTRLLRRCIYIDNEFCSAGTSMMDVWMWRRRYLQWWELGWGTVLWHCWQKGSYKCVCVCVCVCACICWNAFPEIFLYYSKQTLIILSHCHVWWFTSWWLKFTDPQWLCYHMLCWFQYREMR